MRKVFTKQTLMSLLLLVVPTAAWPQATCRNTIALKNINGVAQPVPFASVQVCAVTSTTVPCSPTVQLYNSATESAGTQLPNPFAADANGNYFYCATPAHLQEQVSGAQLNVFQINDVTLPPDPNNPSFTSVTTNTLGVVNATCSGTCTGFAAGGTGITGSGTAGTFPIFTGTTSAGNSNLSQIGAGVLQLTLPSASNIGGLCSEAGQFQINSTVVVAPDGIYFNPLGTSSNVELCAATVSSGLGTSIGIHAAQGNSSFGGGSINLEAGGSGSNNGAQIIVQGSGSAVGGEAIITAGAGLTQGADVQISSGGTTGTGAAGNIDLTTGVGNTTSNDGVVYIQSGSVPSHTAYLYLHAPHFSQLTAPPNNPDTAHNNGALTYCQDCKGTTDGVVVGSIAVNGGTGSDLIYDGTNWRVVTGDRVNIIDGVTLSGTPSTGMIPTATSSTTATWQVPAVVGVTKDFQLASACSPAASTDSSCTGTITISPAFADALYIPQLTINSTNGAFLAVSVSGSLTASSIPYTITCTFNCGTIVTPTIYVHAFHP